MFENCAQRKPQPFKVGSGQPSGPPAWPDAGVKKAFVGIDIAHSGQQGLIQQRGLDRKLAAAKERGKLLRPNRQRLRPRCAEARAAAQVAKLQPPKSPWIHKPQLPAAGQL